MTLHPYRWPLTAGAVLALLALSACGPDTTSSSPAGASSASGASGASASAAPSPSGFTLTVDAAQAALPTAKATADGWATFQSPTLGSDYLCLTSVKRPADWKAATAAWTRRTNGIDYVLEVHVDVAPASDAVAQMLRQATADCPSRKQDGKVNMVNQPIRYSDATGAWNGQWNRSVGTIDVTTTFTQATYLVARDSVLVLVSVVAIPGAKDVEGPEKLGKGYLDGVLAALGA